MSFLLRNFLQASNDISLSKIPCITVLRSHSSFNKEKDKPKEEEEFRVLQVIPKKREPMVRRSQFQQRTFPPRSERMPIDQDWTNVWPGPRTFHPATVPLPVRQGYSQKGAPPGKFANAELMKIPNFLHLTPPAMEKYSTALKQWCTPWPEELKTEEDMDKHFPINIIASDYCHSAPTIRDETARVVSLKVKLSSLELDEHARDKFLRLVGQRYDPETDVLTITTDSCPLKKQNYDYAHYLLTVLYHESWNTEAWESDKELVDQEKYVWENEPSKQSVLKTLAYNNQTAPDLKPLGSAVERLFNKGEDSESLDEYKQNVLTVLKMNG